MTASAHALFRAISGQANAAAPPSLPIEAPEARGPTEKRRIGDAVVCPEQAEAMAGPTTRHCGNCALCWQSDLPIAFVLH